MAATWETIDGGAPDLAPTSAGSGRATPERGDPLKGNAAFFAVGKPVTDALESLTAAEAAQCVPYFRLWRVNPNTGKPMFPADKDPTQPLRPLNLKFSDPPRFGQSIRFAERPEASFSKAVVKQQGHKGRITLTTFELDFTVHDPGALPTITDTKVDSVGSLILPGAVFAIEYGWRASAGVKNVLFNGTGLKTSDGLPNVVPGITRKYFAIHGYHFTPKADGQIEFKVEATEAGMLNLRKLVVGRTDVPDYPEGDKNRLPLRVPNQDFYKTKEGQQAKRNFEQDLQNLKKDGGYVRFVDLLHFFEKYINQAFTEAGYRTIFLKIGRFNERCGTAAPKFGGVVMNAKSIGEFKIPYKVLSDKFRDLLNVGANMTVLNMLKPFIEIINTSSSWSGQNAQKVKPAAGATDTPIDKQTVPEVFLKVVTNGDTIAAYVIDAKREFTRFTDDDRQKSKLGLTSTSAQVRAEVAKFGVPYISLQRANSYVKSANFGVEQDPKITSEFIRRYALDDKRKDQNKSSVSKKVESVDPRALLYTSLIRGDLTMLGNFVFDTFGMVWIDFGVPRWSGPFWIMSNEDTLDRSGFTTKVSLMSCGTDPLGTQGRPRNVTTPGT